MADGAGGTELAAKGVGHGHEQGHPKFLAHHFESAGQQFQAGKTGMWLFLSTELLFFSGLFCAYAVYRHNHPDIFIYAHQFLDKKLGGINTLVLIFSSLTAAWAVRAAQLNQRRLLIGLIVTTFLCACGFLGIKAVEYEAKWKHGLLWGQKFNPGRSHIGIEMPGAKDQPETPASSGGRFGGLPTATTSPAGGHDTTAGAAGGTTAGATRGAAAGADTGAGAAGADTGAGAAGADTGAAAPGSDAGTAAGADTGAAGTAAGNQPSPAAAQTGGHETPPAASPAGHGGATAVPVAGASQAAPGDPLQVATILPPAAAAPPGLALGRGEDGVHHPGADHSQGERPANAQVFFGIYFAMTGLHGIHVIAGMIAWLWVLRRAVRGDFSADYFTPVDLTALYWHLVDLIWIYLFPLLYLIH